MATLFDLVSSLDKISASDALNLLVGTVVSFFVALLVINWLLRYIAHHALTFLAGIGWRWELWCWSGSGWCSNKEDFGSGRLACRTEPVPPELALQGARPLPKSGSCFLAAQRSHQCGQCVGGVGMDHQIGDLVDHGGWRVEDDHPLVVPAWPGGADRPPARPPERCP